MSSNLILSVIIPTYHRNDLLAQCLDCLDPGIQTLAWENYEVIVTDDGYETTAEVMIQEKYSWVQWVIGPKKGPAANRNNGAKYAQGKWLVFTDDDCLPDRTWLSNFLKAIVPEIRVYEGKTICQSIISSPLEYAPVNLTGGYLWSCNMMIHADVFSQLEGFDENFPYAHLEDVDLRERLKLKNYIFQFVEGAIVEHPSRKQQWGASLGKTHESFLYLKSKLKEPISKSSFLYYILSYRIKSLLQFSPSWELLKAIFLMIEELLYVLQKMNQWYKKYPLV